MNMKTWLLESIIPSPSFYSYLRLIRATSITMRFNPITAFALASIISVHSTEAWPIHFQDTSAQTPEYSGKLSDLKDNTCCTFEPALKNE